MNIKWEVKYLICCGCMSVYEEIEEYTALTKLGVYMKFHKKHGKDLPCSYTDRSNFESFISFCNLVSFKTFI